jgi:glycosyltransferase involved in cell wall biosynthesis
VRIPKVSVNIPIYNGEQTIARAVQGILNQTLSDFELIVINDCSKDSTAQILASFSDPRLRVIHHEQNQGIGRTRNDLIHASRGEYIAVLDGDDFALPNRLERQLEAMQKNPGLDGIFSWIRLFVGDDPNQCFDAYLPKQDPKRMREQILFENPFSHSSFFVRRSIMEKGYREDLTCGEDYAKWLELVFEGRKLGMAQELLNCHWSHPPTFYTFEKMRSNVLALQTERFRSLLGRALTKDEEEAHWALYEPTAWTPSNRQEARAKLALARRWIKTLNQSEILMPGFDRETMLHHANLRLYLLCIRAIRCLGVGVLGFSSTMNIEQQAKLLVKAVLERLDFRRRAEQRDSRTVA